MKLTPTRSLRNHTGGTRTVRDDGNVWAEADIEQVSGVTRARMTIA